MHVRVPAEVIAERLYDRDHAGHGQVAVERCRTDRFAGCVVGRPAEPAEQRPVVEEVWAQHLGDGEDPLRMADIGEYLLAQEGGESRGALGGARRAQPAALARERHQELRSPADVLVQRSASVTIVPC